MCPNGVEWKTLGEVAKLERGVVISKEYLRDNAGDYPVYSSQTENNGEFGKINTYRYNGAYVTWTTDGAYAGTVFRRYGKFNITNVCGLINILDKDSIDVNYLYYILSITTKKYVNEGMGNPKLMSNVMAKVKIPLPPLAIQTRIVEILDHFTNLTANLTAELNLRRKQFEHYREKLLSLDGVEGVEWKTLGEVISDLRTGLNPRIHFKLNTDDAQNYYITVRELKGFDFEVDEKTDRINNSAVLRINERSKLKIGDILFSGTGTIGRTALIKRLPTNYNIKEGVYAITPKTNIIDSKFLIYLLHTDLIMDVINSKSGGSTVRSIPMAELKNIPLPIPSLKIQHSIVSILDKFTALIENIEKELALRQKQYEYYREELLRFGG